MFAAFSLLTAAMNCGQVVGVDVIPACLKSVFVVPEPHDADAVGDGVLLAVHLPAGRRATDRLDPRLDVLGDVRDLARLHLVDQRAAAPFLEDVRRVVRRERERDLGLLQDDSTRIRSA